MALEVQIINIHIQTFYIRVDIVKETQREEIQLTQIHTKHTYLRCLCVCACMSGSV